MRRKNIIVYLSDQQRWDTLSPGITPYLTQLASEGVLYQNHFTCHPVGAPAKACLQTGVYASQNGCYANGVPLLYDRMTLAEHLKTAGYDTAFFGNWHLASDRLPHIGRHFETAAIPRKRRGGYRYWRGADVLEETSHGYDGFVFDEAGRKQEFKGYRADAINDYALEYLDKRDPEKPFFMLISQLEPHHQKDRRCIEGYRPTVNEFRDYPVPVDLAYFDGDYRELYPDYISAINRLDYNVGRIVTRLKQMDIYDDTVLIYTSDHGCHFRTRNAGYNGACHDVCIRTPLIICGGVFYGRKRETRLTSLIDLPPTILSIAGVPMPPEYMGHDLSRLIEEPDLKRQNVFIQFNNAGVIRAIRTERYTYAVRAPAPSGYAFAASALYFEEYLYDNREDPCQLTNLIRDPASQSIREELRRQLKAQMQLAGEHTPLILPAIKSKDI